MGVHCYLTELGTTVTMAAKIVAVVVTLASLAAAEPGYGYGGVAYHPYGGNSYTHRSPQGLHGHYGGYGYGHGYGKRSAEAEPGYGYGHGYGAASVYVSQADHGYGYNPAHYTYGYNIHKRSADAEPGYGYGHATSYTHRSPQGLHGHYGGYGHGGYGHGYGKRSDDAGYYGGASSYVHQTRPYYHGSYGYGINHYGKRSADAGYLGYGGYGHGYGYGHGGSSYQHVNSPYSNYGVSVAHPY